MVLIWGVTCPHSIQPQTIRQELEGMKTAAVAQESHSPSKMSSIIGSFFDIFSSLSQVFIIMVAFYTEPE